MDLMDIIGVITEQIHASNGIRIDYENHGSIHIYRFVRHLLRNYSKAQWINDRMKGYL